MPYTARKFAEGVRSEWLILLLCARSVLTKSQRDAISNLGSGNVDWKHLFHIAREHGMLPLLHWHLSAICPARVRELKYEITHIAARNLFLTRELIRVVELLEADGIDIVPFKGPTLAALVYGDLSLRQFGDLDVLVKAEDVERARGILTRSGYQTEFAAESAETAFILKAERVLRFILPGGVVVEMHWEFDPRNLASPVLADAGLWQRCTEQPIAGKAMRVLSRGDLILYLCSHGAKHCWDRLEWICCIAELMHPKSGLDWAWINAQARSRGAERVVSLGLALARDLIGERVGPGDTVPDSVSERLAARVWGAMFDKTREATRMASYRYWFYLKTRERISDRARMLLFSSAHLVRPHQLWRKVRTSRLEHLLLTEDTLNQQGSLAINRPTVYRRIYNWQNSLCERIDSLLPTKFSVDGAKEFLSEVVPGEVRPGLVVYDVGGGKHPVIDVLLKRSLGVRLIGLDVDELELRRAPPGAYDAVICADISAFRGNSDADLVICSSVLEHVRDTESAIKSIASILKRHGRAVLFVPGRNTVFARINLMLPERIKKTLLYFLLPSSRTVCGFQAFYDRCTPADFERLARSAGLIVEQERHYFYSPYFTWCAPLHAFWRVWVVCANALFGRQTAEAFAMVLRRE